MAPRKKSTQNKEFFEAILMLEKEKGIPADFLLEKVCAAIVTSVRKDYGGADVVFCDCNPEKNQLRVYVKKTVVEEVQDELTEITQEEAVKFKKNADKVSSFCCDVIGDICGVLSGAISAVIVLKMTEYYGASEDIQFIMSALVASLTVGGKAFTKGIAKRNSTKIIGLVCKFINVDK